MKDILRDDAEKKVLPETDTGSAGGIITKEGSLEVSNNKISYFANAYFLYLIQKDPE